MSKKLDEADSRVVDLLLDRGAASPSDTGVFVTSVNVSPERVHSIKEIFSLLKECPTEEPAPDLAGRTLRRVDAALAAMDTPPPGAPNPTNLNADRPSA